MKLKNKIMIALNYTFAYLYLFLGSIGVCSGIAMLADMSIDFMIESVFRNGVYWFIVVGLTVLIGTKQNISEGWFFLD